MAEAHAQRCAQEHDGEHDGGHVGGMLVVAGTQVSLPVSALREVVPLPGELFSLPLRIPGLLGAMRLRELVVPVVDLGEHLRTAGGGTAPTDGGPTSACAREEVVVLVSHDDRVVGILAQEVRGVVHVPSTHLLSLRADDGPLLVSHVFQGEDGGVVSVLDPAHVLALPGVPTVREPARTGARDTAGAGDPVATWALLRCGEQLLALDVRFVHTTLPAARPRASVVDGGVCLGVTRYAGLDVAVVDPLRLLEVGAAAPHGDGSSVVLRLETGYVVLAVTELVGLEPVAGSASMSVPASVAARPDLVGGMADLPGYGPCLVLDGDALLADAGLRSLAATNVSPDAPAPGASPTGASPTGGSPTGGSPTGAPPAMPGPATAGAGAAPSYLTYRAGIPLATRLDQVSEILDLPGPGALLVARGEPGDHQAVLGVVSHQGAALPVVHLPTLLGTSQQDAAHPSSGGCLLVVGAGARRVAFAVDSLHEIEALTWTDPAPRTPGPRTDVPEDADTAGRAGVRVAREVLTRSPLIQVGGAPALLRDVDLGALALTVADGGGVVSPA